MVRLVSNQPINDGQILKVVDIIRALPLSRRAQGASTIETPSSTAHNAPTSPTAAQKPLRAGFLTKVCSAAPTPDRTTNTILTISVVR